MKRNLALANVQKSFGQRQQEKAIKEKDCRDFQCTTDGLPAHRQRRKPDYEAKKHHRAAHPAMGAQVTIAERARELEWDQDDEEQGGNDVHQGQNAFLRKCRIQARKLGRSIARRIRQRRHSADNRGSANEAFEAGQSPAALGLKAEKSISTADIQYSLSLQAFRHQRGRCLTYRTPPALERDVRNAAFVDNKVDLHPITAQRIVAFCIVRGGRQRPKVPRMLRVIEDHVLIELAKKPLDPQPARASVTAKTPSRLDFTRRPYAANGEKSRRRRCAEASRPARRTG